MMQAVFDSMSPEHHGKMCSRYCGAISGELNPKHERRCAEYTAAYLKAREEAAGLGVTFKIKMYNGTIVTGRRKQVKR